MTQKELNQPRVPDVGVPVATASTPAEDIGTVLTVRRLMWIKFSKNRIAVVSGVVLIVMYLVMAFAEFFAPYEFRNPHRDFLHHPPQRLRFFDEGGQFHLRPFVYRTYGARDPNTFLFVYREDTEQRDHIRFFVRGDAYRMWFWESDRHFFGVEEGHVFLFGTDLRGRCMLSRIILGSRVSLTVGLIGVTITVLLGSVLGTLSGYFGGRIDNLIQRVIELIRSFPQLPLWMALSAAIPPTWPSNYVYFGIIMVLSLIGWTGLAREVRGKVLSMRNMDFVLAAESSGAGTGRLVFVHMIPNMASHIIVTATLGIPIMILGESALSFLGLGIKPPLTSWGLLLSQAQRIEVLRLYPWLLIPGVFIFIAVLAYNFLGDGLRDAVDPFSS